MPWWWFLLLKEERANCRLIDIQTFQRPSLCGDSRQMAPCEQLSAVSRVCHRRLNGFIHSSWSRFMLHYRWKAQRQTMAPVNATWREQLMFQASLHFRAHILSFSSFCEHSSTAAKNSVTIFLEQSNGNIIIRRQCHCLSVSGCFSCKGSCRSGGKAVTHLSQGVVQLSSQSASFCTIRHLNERATLTMDIITYWTLTHNNKCKKLTVTGSNEPSYCIIEQCSKKYISGMTNICCISSSILLSLIAILSLSFRPHSVPSLHLIHFRSRHWLASALSHS